MYGNTCTQLLHMRDDADKTSVLLLYLEQRADSNVECFAVE